MTSIFIVDDDTAQSKMLKDFLTNSDLNIMTFNSGEECLKNLDIEPEIIFLDYNFDKSGDSSMNGIDILKKIKAARPNVEVIMLSGQDKIEVAMNTLEHGAYDYIVKGETAFHRAGNLIEKITNRGELKSSLALYKRIMWAMGAALVITIIFAFGFSSASKAGWFR